MSEFSPLVAILNSVFDYNHRWPLNELCFLSNTLVLQNAMAIIDKFNSSILGWLLPRPDHCPRWITSAGNLLEKSVRLSLRCCASVGSTE